MIYQGSKERISKNLLPFIQTCIEANKLDLYIEPFVGGANLIDKVKCRYRVGFDINHWVITLLRYMRDDPALTIAPDDCSFDEYRKVRDSYNKGTKNYSDELKAMLGYFASYGGRFFDGGYGRDKTGKRNIYKERLIYAKKQAPLLEGITFVEDDYRQIVQVMEKDTPCLIYCDPPYKGTKQYGSCFNHASFYDWLEEISQEHFVLISEYSMPPGFVKIWHKEQKVMQKSNRNTADIRTEGLYTLENGKYHTWWKDKMKWQRLLDSYFTPGGDPVWYCPKCLNGHHIYGVEHQERIHKCPSCGTELLYPDEEKEFTFDYRSS